MAVKDVTLFRGEEAPVVTGDPGEVAKLKSQGWTDVRPVRKTSVAPQAVVPKPATPKPAEQSK